ncbi:MAG: KamA family radical SAM protein [Sandaracinaceae bacterium]|nr:KamA family radical SAM protein [Sandaracinaceae bacterium]
MQLRNAITDLAGLEATFRLTDSEREGARRALEAGLPISITPYYASLVDPDDERCPIRLQCVPRAEEAVEVEGDLADPLGEVAHEVAPDLVQRYPDRALLLVSDRCSVYCRFCTRSRMVGQGGGARSMDHLEPAFEYLAAHPEVREVIVSGGDPLVASTARIRAILERLAGLGTLDTVRIATRVPVTLPSRIDDALCRVLREAFGATWVMTHFNHPRELTERSSRALARLVDHGLPVMNQTVLLRGVNDSAETLEALFRGLVARRVRPYYLLQADPVRGTSHLRTPLSTGVEIMRRLQGRLSGIALPKLIVDTPGGLGKVPHGPDWVVGAAGGVTTFQTFRGDVVDYVDPPEKP